MYLCNCKGVTENQVLEAIEEGLCTRGAIAQCLRVGTACGKCTPDLRRLLKREVSAGETTLASLLSDHSAESFVLPASPKDSKLRHKAPPAPVHEPAKAGNSGPSKGFRAAEPNGALG